MASCFIRDAMTRHSYNVPRVFHTGRHSYVFVLRDIDDVWGYMPYDVRIFYVVPFQVNVSDDG